MPSTPLDPGEKPPHHIHPSFLRRAAHRLRTHPVGGAFLLLALCTLARCLDIFVLRLDEAWGEIFLSKSLGLMLILAFLAVLGRRLGILGHNRRQVFLSVVIGSLLSMAIFAIAYSIEFTVLAGTGDSPRLILAAIDPKAGVDGGVLFGLWLLVGNVVNALMEEGLFRGVFLPLLMTRYSPWRSNLIQAALFGLWHLVWPLKAFLTGEQSAMGALASGALILLGSFIIGLLWGYLCYRTGSLWAPVAAHVVANSIQNLLHVSSDSGMDVALASVRGVAAGFLGLAAIAVIAWLAPKWRLQTLRAPTPAALLLEP